MIELLAPAKDKLCAKAAVDYGADAIYIGASEFGARKNVPNSIEDIKEIIEYAHKFKVKVFVTINTILTDAELSRAKELIEKISLLGVDAFIIQDMGLLECVQKMGVPAHASTQCDNRTPEKVKFLESVGFTRVILARELSVEQIKEIRKQTNVELETFIQGALCVSYSGQCYLSQAIGGRSANRGECAQPCRKKYTLVDSEGSVIAKDKHLLSLKDFNASEHIKELALAGVNSFKIEGRLKDENYVKNVVGYYRKLIDNLAKDNALFKKSSSGKVAFDFEPNLDKSFNRGFTDYFLDGKRKEIYSFNSPKSKGEYLGKVTKVSRDNFEINLSQNITVNSQDGLCFISGGELAGCLVNKSEKNRIYPNKMEKIKIGTEIYRNADVGFEKHLKNSKTCRKISMSVEFDLGKIKAVDEDGTLAEVNYEFEEFAQNEDKMLANIINQLKKSGDSIFLVEDVKFKTEKIPFIQVSKLNEVRRDLIEKLEQVRLQNYERVDYSQKTLGSEFDYPQSEIDYRGNILNKDAKLFYEKHGCKVVESALECGKSATGKSVMTTKHCLKHAFNMCKSPKKLYLIDEKGKRYELKFNCNKCEMEIVF